MSKINLKKCLPLLLFFMLLLPLGPYALSAHAEVIIDNSDADFTSAPTDWSSSSYSSGYYGSNYQYSSAGNGSNSATWTFEIFTAGDYEVFAQWTSHRNRANDAPYTIRNNGSELATVPRNQRQDGGQFNSLGIHQLELGTLEVVLTNTPSGYVIADAVRIVSIASPDLAYIEIEGPADVNENSTAAYSCRAYYTDFSNQQVACDWSDTCNAGDIAEDTGSLTTFEVTSDESCGITASYSGLDDTYPITIRDVVVPSLDHIEIEGPADVNENSTATYSCRAYYSDDSNEQVTCDTWSDACTGGDIVDGSLTTFEVTSDESCGITGYYSGLEDTHPITIRDVVVPEEVIIDNSDADFTSAPTDWSSSSYSSGYYGSNYQYSSAGNGSNSATWTFEIFTAGDYEVFAQWTSHSNRANDAPYTIRNNGSELATVPRNQRQDGGQFNSLGIYQLDPGTLEVVLTNTPSGYVIADAVRIVSIASPDLTSIEVEGPADVNENSTATYSCRAYYSDDSNQQVSCDNWIDACTGGDIVDGSLTTFEVTSDESCGITASYSGLDDTYPITIRDVVVPSLDHIEIEGPADVNENSTATYSCRAYYTDFSNQQVACDWSDTCNAGDIAEDTGSLTTFEVTSDESCGITASYSGLDDTYPITIRDVVVPSLDHIEIEGPADVNENSTATYSCRAYYTDFSNQQVACDWSDTCNAGDIAEDTGSLTTFEVTSDESCGITASYSGLDDTYPITIRDVVVPTLTSIEIEGPADVNENSTATYSCRAYYSDGSNQLVAPDTCSDTCTAGFITDAGSLTTSEVTSDESCQITGYYSGLEDTYPITIKDVVAPENFIIDNSDSGFTSAPTNWSSSSHSSGYYGTNYQYSSAGNGSNSATWTFDVFTAGDYEIFAQWTSNSNRANDAPYTIRNNGSELATVPANQRVNGGQFNSLGIYQLEPGTLEVVLSSSPSGYVIADAVRVITSLPVEHIYAFFGYGPEYSVPDLLAMLSDIGASEQGDIWVYETENKTFYIHIIDGVEGQEELKQALETEDAHILFYGHSNYGLGPIFATRSEIQSQVLNDVLYIDDDRILNFSSKWIHVNISGMRTGQAYPHWWSNFQDGKSGIMPYDFDDDPVGEDPYKYDDPPYNYYLTYKVPGDPTFHKVETVRSGAIERFPYSTPAWYSPTGDVPDPDDDVERQHYITNPEPWSPSFESTGDWIESQTIAGYFKENYLHIPSGVGNNEVEWIFNIPEAGNYKVSAWWSASSGRTNNAPYTINYASGNTTILKNQRVDGGKWNELGEFSFDANEYSVKLTDDADGGNVVADAVRIVHVDNAPEVVKAHFAAWPRSGPAPLAVYFDSESVGDFTDRNWIFGDGSTNDTRNSLTHTYTEPGTYTVSLQISGPLGSDTVTKTSYITVGDTPPVLQAEFTASTQEGRTPREVSFQDRSSGNIDSWSWDFGDGQTSTEPNPTHTYLTPGLFTVTLTITDVDDISTTEQKEAFVSVIVFDKSLDNVDYPKRHFSSKTILFRKEMEISKEELKYARMFYLSCNSGNYYIDTFNRGIMFYTLNTSAMEGGTGFALYLQAYLEGKTDQEIWEILQGYEAVFDYYDFNKLPSEQ